VNLSHSWVWEPKTGKVSYEGKDKDGKPVKVTYLRSELSSQPDAVKNEVDPAMHKLPVGSGSAELVAVKYPAEGGYTPGDTWELYVGKDNRVQQLVYHRGGPKNQASSSQRGQATRRQVLC